MIDDEAEYEARRQIRAQADADVAAFISSLDQDEGTGVPPPVRITVSEVSTKPVQFDPFAFGQEGSGASPAPQPPPPPVPAACCLPDDSCEMLTSTACVDAGGTFHPGQTCDDNPCVVLTGACAICDTCIPNCTCYSDVTSDECDALRPPFGSSGFLAGGNCVTNDCCYFFEFMPCCGSQAPLGACCGFGNCLDMITVEECDADGGTFYENNFCLYMTFCNPSECGTP